MKVYLGLGSNLGDRENYLRMAVKKLKEIPDTKLERISGVYATKAWGVTEQPDFWNLVLLIDTGLSPINLLRRTQAIENELGRVRTIKWGPRTIDIDILVYDNIVCESQELILPHPLIEQRAFVTIPLKEIAPSLVLPSGTKVIETQDSEEVKLIKSTLDWTIS